MAFLDSLMNLLADDSKDGETQLRAAQEQQAQVATPQQEALARENGFNSYNEMAAWQAQRSRKREPTTEGEKIKGAEKAKKDAMAIHPKSMFERLAEMFADINRR